jgi:hypothetical protein
VQHRDGMVEVVLVPRDVACAHPNLAELTDGQLARFERGIELGDGEHHIVVSRAHFDLPADERLLQG